MVIVDVGVAAAAVDFLPQSAGVQVQEAITQRLICQLFESTQELKQERCSAAHVIADLQQQLATAQATQSRLEEENDKLQVGG